MSPTPAFLLSPLSLHHPACRTHLRALPHAAPAPRCVPRPARVVMHGDPHAQGATHTPATGELPLIKKFLNDVVTLGKLRLVATNDAAVMEAIVPDTAGLFYAEVPTKGEYANIIDPKINLDMHLRLAGVGAARFEQGTSRGPAPAPTYIVRLLGTDHKTLVMSLFLQWEKDPRDVSEDRVNAWRKMKETYCKNGADTVTF